MTKSIKHNNVFHKSKVPSILKYICCLVVTDMQKEKKLKLDFKDFKHCTKTNEEKKGLYCLEAYFSVQNW